MPDAIGCQLKPDCSDAHDVRKRRAIERKSKVVREIEEVVEGSLRNEIEHLVISQFRNIHFGFIRPKRQVIDEEMALPLVVPPVFDDEHDFLQVRPIVRGCLYRKIKPRPIRLVWNRKQLTAQLSAIRAFEFHLHLVRKIAFAIAARPKSEIGDMDIFNARRISRAIAQAAVKVGEI